MLDDLLAVDKPRRPFADLFVGLLPVHPKVPHLLGLAVDVGLAIDKDLDHDQHEEEDVDAGEDGGGGGEAHLWTV